MSHTPGPWRAVFTDDPRGQPVVYYTRHVAEAQLNVLALGAEFVERLRELDALRGDNVCVDHEAPLLADYNERVISRMVASVRNGGTIRA